MKHRVVVPDPIEVERLRVRSEIALKRFAEVIERRSPYRLRQLSPKELDEIHRPPPRPITYE